MQAGELRAAVRAGRPVLGAFVKTASHQAVELLARAGLDLVIADAEHAPLGLETLGAMALAARAWRTALLVRPVDLAPGFIGQCLDMGFSGVLAPHVDSPAAAGAVLDATRYDRGRRGFSPSTRAADYGAADAGGYRREVDQTNSVWVQIEDAAALGRLDAIAATADVDCLFIGRADLAASLGVERIDDAAVVEAVKAICAAGARAGRAVGLYVGRPEEIAPFRAMGIGVFVCGSDQSWLLAQGARVRAAFAAATGS
ncbi:MAG TPA: aldolase/citrate lyase family protein [Caulobacteraceae bacterium]|jgi:2-keto-3-deoxy-L-rhamnonate aldolase RhmA|nr:aldolase/citrate lyase family protein [Caulobacteraceae bacterium]